MRLRSSPLADGERAPDFTLPDQDGKPVALADLLADGPMVVFFYPKAFTPVCTAEACGFSDQISEFSELGAGVVGISADDIATQKRFHEEHKLAFPLLSDDGSVYGAFGLRTSSKAQMVNDRVTFVIDADGVVRSHSTGMMASAAHVRESLDALRSLDRT